MLKTEIAACINNVGQITACDTENTFIVYNFDGDCCLFVIGDKVTICSNNIMITGKVEAISISDNIIIIDGEEIKINKINCMIIY